jgi:hypothetical protein
MGNANRNYAFGEIEDLPMEWRYLSYSISAAIDGLTIAELEGTASWRNGHVLRLPPSHGWNGGDFLHRQAVLAVTRSPVEWLAAAEGLAALDGRCHRRGHNTPSLANCGLHHISNWVHDIPLIVPRTLKAIGNRFLFKCDALQKLDLDATNLETIGDDFMTPSQPQFRELTFPSTLKSVGSGCLIEFRGSRLDFSSTVLETEVIAFSPPLKCSTCGSLPPCEWWDKHFSSASDRASICRKVLSRSLSCAS